MDRIERATPQKFLREFFQLNLKSKYTFFLGNNKQHLKKDEFFRLLISGHSLYRWGDGETAISRGKSISYQKFEPELAERILCILTEKSEKVIHGISWSYFEGLISRKWSIKNIRVFLSTKLLLARHLQLSEETKTVETMIWYSNYQHIPAVAKEISRFRQLVLIASDERFLSSFPNNTIFVPASAKDSFSDYQVIRANVAQLIDRFRPANLAIFVAIGPTSKLVFADFHHSAQVIDIGHGLNFLHNGDQMYAWKTNLP